jgi:hypothetical protein
MDPPDLRWPDAEPIDGAGPAVADEPVWRIDEDVIAGSTTVHIHDGGESIIPNGRRLYAAETLRLIAWDAEPAHAELHADVVYRWQEYAEPNDPALHRIEIRARSWQRSDATDFDLEVDLEVDLDDARFFARSWRERIPRDHV